MADGCTEGCTRDSHIFYDPTSVEVVRGLMGPTDEPAPPAPCVKYWNNRDDLDPRRRDPWYRDWYAYSCTRYMEWEPQEERSTGMVSQEQLSGVDWGGIQDRNVSWAFLRQTATGKTFLMLSLHLPNEKNALGERVRRAVATALPGWAASLSSSLGVGGVPVLVGGDLNSYQERQPSGAHAILDRSGYTDGFAAKDRVNERFATINKNGVTNARFGGWPARPYKYNRPGTRIDYVFGAGVTPLRYELFLRLRGDGSFDERYRASDHNPVITTWQF
jgi:endonuclease/exonuclease/phosphatase family metal-dependent hydrolase